tara:strand:+ start:670 stop:921 length:252 start_codon:yes stop_codon:yes gene_type:complete
MIANKMAEVADNLAQEEYGEYPDIQVEMKEATRHVREQVAALNRAINELSVRALSTIFLLIAIGVIEKPQWLGSLLNTLLDTN